MYTRLLLLFVFSSSTLCLFAQLTLDVSNFPPIKTYRVSSTNDLGSLPFAGENMQIFLDTTATSSAGQISYEKVSDDFFMKDCDAYSVGSMNVNGLTYNVNYYFSTNQNGFHENGIYIPAQAYSQGALTGNNKDSIIFEEQKYILTQPREILQFPVSAGYFNESVSRRVAKFKIHIPAYGLNYAPAQHVANVVRQDTVTGWGKMRVYTPSGPSPAYDVLVLFSLQHQIDSFYLNGNPAPGTLLTAFGQKQGQRTNVRNRIYYYRANRSAPLLLANLNEDVTAFTSLFFDADSLSQPSATGEFDASFITTLFPNPTVDYLNYNLQGSKTTIDFQYRIYDFTGKDVSSICQIEKTENGMQANTSLLPGGSYTICAFDKHRPLTHDQFIVHRR